MPSSSASRAPATASADTPTCCRKPPQLGRCRQIQSPAAVAGRPRHAPPNSTPPHSTSRFGEFSSSRFGGLTSSIDRYSWTHLFAAVRPASGEGFALVLPEVSAKAMNEFLAQFAATLAEDEHAIM